MKLQEIMTTRLEFIDADTSLYDAIEKMVDRRIRSLVVRFSGKGTEYGVITARDIVFKVLTKKINLRDIRVSEIASKPIVCIEKNVSLCDAARLMEETNIARIFVAEAETIIGVVSLVDLMEAALLMRARGEDAS